MTKATRKPKAEAKVDCIESAIKRLVQDHEAYFDAWFCSIVESQDEGRSRAKQIAQSRNKKLTIRA